MNKSVRGATSVLLGTHRERWKKILAERAYGTVFSQAQFLKAQDLCFAAQRKLPHDVRSSAYRVLDKQVKLTQY